MDDVERFRSAQRLLAAGDPHSALQVLQPLLASAPDDASVLLLAGCSYFDTAQLERAEATFRRLAEHDPADHYAHACLGRTLLRRHRPTEACRHLRIAAALQAQPWYLDCLRDAEAAATSRPEGPSTPTDDHTQPHAK